MRRKSVLLVAACVLAANGGAFAFPHDGEECRLKQPDGTHVAVRVWGDEFYQRVEGLDGYTLVRDPNSGWICYALLSADGSEFESSGIVYDPNGPGANPVLKNRLAALDLKPGVKLTREARLRNVLEAQKLLGVGEGDDAAGPGKNDQPAPQITGNFLGLTLLIDFPDEPATIPRTEVDNYCNEIGYSNYSNNGSIRDYFYDVSNGLVEYTNHVTEYYTALNSKSYYTDSSISYGKRARELILEALNALEAQGFDFSTLSTNSSNKIRAINTFYAGSRDNAWSQGLWPHKGTVSPVFQADGVESGGYQISNVGIALKLGTFCHENGHLLFGWPDLYDYGGESSGIGSYCLMASSGSSNPRPPNPWLRHTEGWETLIDINADPGGTLYSHVANSFTTYRYRNPLQNTEYFLIESRLETGRHRGIPDEGLLIWHIDTNGSNNNEQMTPDNHYKVSVEQADGLFELERGRNGGGVEDLFHAGYRDRFSDTTLPDARWWSGENSGLVVYDISDVGTTMTFRKGIPLYPYPASRALDVPVDVTLSWTGGVPGASAYDVYFGESATAVAGATTTSLEYKNRQVAPWWDPGTLQPSRAYYWRVDIISPGPQVFAGEVWEFNTIVDPASLDINLRVYWAFDEGSGTIATDASGSGNDGTITGASWNANGRSDTALHFDGTDDKVVRSLAQSTWPAYSVSVWVKAAAVGQPQYASVFNNDSDGNDFQLDVDGKNPGQYRYRGVANKTIGLVTRDWVHLVAVCEGGKTDLYYNGERTATVYTADRVFGQLAVGVNRGGDKYFAGVIDEVRVWDRALSVGEIKHLARLNNIRFPVVHWPFEEGSGSTAGDASGNGNDGAISGGALWTSGVEGGALQFDGLDDQVVAGMTQSTWSAYSVALWAKAGVLGQSVNCSVFNNDSSGADFQFDVDGSNPGNYRFNGAVDGVFAPVTTEWMHLAASCDGAKTTLYVNGAAVTDLPTVDNLFGQVAAGVNRAGTRFFNGVIDDIRVYDVALRDGEIAELYGQYSPPNRAPVFARTAVDGPDATETVPYLESIADKASDPDVGDTLTFSKVDGPEWLSVAPDGTLTGTPQHADVGVNLFTVRVEDSAGATDDMLLTILVKERLTSAGSRWRLY